MCTLWRGTRCSGSLPNPEFCVSLSISVFCSLWLYKCLSLRTAGICVGAMFRCCCCHWLPVVLEGWPAGTGRPRRSCGQLSLFLPRETRAVVGRSVRPRSQALTTGSLPLGSWAPTFTPESRVGLPAFLSLLVKVTELGQPVRRSCFHS